MVAVIQPPPALCRLKSAQGWLQFQNCNHHQRRKLEEEAWKLVEHLPAPAQRQSNYNPAAAQKKFIAENIDKISDDRGWRYLFGGLSAPLQFKLLRRLLQKEPAPSLDDWRNIFRPVYEFKDSWQGWGVNLALTLLCLLGLWELGSAIWQSPQLLSWENGLSALMMLALTALLWWVGRGQLDLEAIELIMFFGFLSFGPLAGYTLAVITGNWVYGAIVGAIDVAIGGAIDDAIGGAIVGAIGYSLIYLPTRLFADQWGWTAAAGFWLVWLVWSVGLWRYGARRQRQAQNPLRGLLDSQPGPAVRVRARRFRLPGPGVLKWRGR